MNAIMVCVDYWDILSLTLPYNRHHFNRVLVVTTPRDKNTMRVAIENEAEFYTTESFYEPGAVFNKWKALEEGLDHFTRHGWLCIMDADVVWPRELPPTTLTQGHLYTPRRRVAPWPIQVIPPEDKWADYPLYREVEFAGYTQMFHGEDPVLGVSPWHETNWKHCGGADSFFQRKWPEELKVRPSWVALHLGSPARNWYGRTTPYADGTLPEGGEDRAEAMRRLFRQHRGGNYSSERY